MLITKPNKGSPEGHSNVGVRARYDIGSCNVYGTTPGIEYGQVGYGAVPGTIPNHTVVGECEYISFQGNRKMVATLDHEELDCWFSIGEISFYFILIFV